MRILGFWHIATIGQWRMILESQLAKIMASGLYEASHNIFVNIAGTSEAAPLPDAFDNRKFAVSCSRLEQWEYPTLRVLQERARQEEACCWYIHLKGVSHSIEGEQSCVRGWREYMEYFVIENWRLCMEQLVDHDAVGVQWKTGPRPHFSGNFWWANASYVRRLASIEDVERVAQGGRHEAEFWIGSGRPRVKCLHAFDRDLYTRIVGREEYREYAESDGDAWADFTTLPSRERILRYANRAGSDSLAVFGGMYEGGCYLQQVPEEIADLVYRLQASHSRFACYLEIGAAAGGSGRFLDTILKFDAVYVIDNNRHSRSAVRPQNLPRAVEYVGDSHSEQCRQVVNSWNVRFDLILIDGDHTYNGVKKDTELALAFAKEGGFIVFHDSIAVADVGRWTNELKAGLIPRVKHCFSIGDRLGLDVFRVASGDAVTQPH